MVLYGGGNAVRSGLIGRVQVSLVRAGILCSIKGGIRPNPVMEFAEETVWEYQNKGIDLVLAVGGWQRYGHCQGGGCGPGLLRR